MVAALRNETMGPVLNRGPCGVLRWAGLNWTSHYWSVLRRVTDETVDPD